MSKALIGGHANRALDFYNTPMKYFIVGGTTPWITEISPPTPSDNEYSLVDVIGLKKVDNLFLIIPVGSTPPEGEIGNYLYYRNQYWKKIIPPTIAHTVSDVYANETVIPVRDLGGLVAGSKIRILDSYEVYITKVEIRAAATYITIDTPLPVPLPSSTEIVGGSIVEGAKHVYLDCSLEFERFPLADNDGIPVTYRQIGLCTRVVPATEYDPTNPPDTILSARYSASRADEYTSLGTLEILDNRRPSTRDVDQREKLSLIIEF